MKKTVRIFCDRLPVLRNMPSVLAGAIIGFVFTASVFAQTSAYTFQGKLNDGGVAANTTYDMRFMLFDLAGSGNQIGSTVTRTNVATVAGIFTVQFDFVAAR